ncbi:GGDEF domain-containing protein [Nocardiopsis sediminis]|uniref:GGDEF domain-containing protein n=1 Tax=Nocardiopsis sediminis TaxID=1778267 RepID=A0ABV8FSV5_9ACTN
MAVAERTVPERAMWVHRVRSWPVFGLPRSLAWYLGALLAGALGVLLTAIALTPIRPQEAGVFLALVACAGGSVEAMRRLGSPAVLTRDLLGAWWFPTLLLLPPVYALLIPIPVYLLLQYRHHRGVVHRRVFNVASAGLSGFLASLAFHTVLAGDPVRALSLPVDEAERTLVTGPGAILALLCCAIFTVLNTTVVAVAVHLSAPETPWKRTFWDREAFTIDSAELCVGLTVAIMTGLSMVLLLIALPPVMLLQRSLLYQQLQAAARTDPKTGLLNAAAWEAEAATEVARAHQSGDPVAVLIVDIDHFKGVNDTYGHLFGDHVLAGVATTLTHQLRPTDAVGRFGGEEFVVLLPGADMAEACRAAERLRMRVGRMVLKADDAGVSITVSIGVAVLGVHGDDIVGLLAAADLALYRAKGAGRNRVCLPLTGRTLRGRTGPVRPEPERTLPGEIHRLGAPACEESG